MIFGKIEYLNLLPFHIFMKRYLRSSQAKAIMQYKESVPAKINKSFAHRDVDAAFISSITAQKSRYLSLGIIANKKVQSVLVIPSRKSRSDKESASSNVLAKILGVEGEVLIGDKALSYALQNSDYIDLADEWYKRYRLPFVFALLCYNKDAKRYEKISKMFLKHKPKIPHYLLQQAAKKRGIRAKDVQAYLKLISYELTPKAKQGLKHFYKEAKKISA
jgi:chorismate dehydratase